MSAIQTKPAEAVKPRTQNMKAVTWNRHGAATYAKSFEEIFKIVGRNYEGDPTDGFYCQAGGIAYRITVEPRALKTTTLENRGRRIEVATQVDVSEEHLKITPVEKRGFQQRKFIKEILQWIPEATTEDFGAALQLRNIRE